MISHQADLLAAVRALDVAAAERMLDIASTSGQLSDIVNAADEDGQTLLHECSAALRSSDDAQLRGDQMIALLLRHGSPLTPNRLGESALTLAARAVAGAFSIVGGSTVWNEAT
ncbi:unnamed protein product [Polarella glacialis]|uniref:Uncharacterized protein n=1 Tax=Polarella glacialis TaxID=89957 RepID=A0A813DJ86_POLGL|nr:unnamed protein product [Polarella glacialis]